MRINLTKEDTLLLKGAAIMAIIFHNFYHKFEGGIVENEFTFHRGCNLNCVIKE